MWRKSGFCRGIVPISGRPDLPGIMPWRPNGWNSLLASQKNPRARQRVAADLGMAAGGFRQGWGVRGLPAPGNRARAAARSHRWLAKVYADDIATIHAEPAVDPKAR